MEIRKLLIQVLSVWILIFLFFSTTSLAASRRHQKGWDSQKGSDFYLDASGRRLKGLQVIEGETYFFTGKGILYHGWKKLEDHYVYFASGRRSQGKMLKNRTVNGFRLDGNGYADLPSKGEQERMRAFVYISGLMNRLTKAGWGPKRKLRAIFDYASKLPYLYDENDKTAAQCVLKFKKQIDGDCGDTNTTMAFAGALLGFESFVEDNFDHWWAKINGKIYDTNFQNFAVPEKKAGMNGTAYAVLQAVSPDSHEAGDLIMTVHPERYGYIAAFTGES